MWHSFSLLHQVALFLLSEPLLHSGSLPFPPTSHLFLSGLGVLGRLIPTVFGTSATSVCALILRPPHSSAETRVRSERRRATEKVRQRETRKNRKETRKRSKRTRARTRSNNKNKRKGKSIIQAQEMRARSQAKGLGTARKLAKNPKKHTKKNEISLRIHRKDASAANMSELPTWARDAHAHTSGSS